MNKMFSVWTAATLVAALIAEAPASALSQSSDLRRRSPDCVASSTAFTGARIDAPFFVFDGGSQGDGFGQFDHPMAIADVGRGRVVIADRGNHRLKLVSVEGFFQDFWGEAGSAPGDFREPGGIAAAGDGTVWIADTGNHRVQRLQAHRDDIVSLTGTPVSSIGRRGRGNGAFERPTDVAVDSAGRLYVVDAGNRRIQKFSKDGKFLAQWSRELEEPHGIAIDAADTIFVTDSARHRVVMFDTSGRVIASWGEHGARPGQLDRPRGLAIRDAMVYVADSGNDRVQKFDLRGRFVAAVGCRGTEVGQFLEPIAVAIDGDRHLYVVDRGNHRIQKLSHQ